MKLKELREQHGLTQAEIANAIGVPEEIIIGIENETIKPTINQVVKLSNLFQCRADSIFPESSFFDQQFSPQESLSSKHKKDIAPTGAKLGIGCLFYALVFLIVGIFSIFLVSSIVESGSCKNPIDVVQQTISKPAQNSDINIDTEFDLLIGFSLIITPNCDIDNLEIMIKYYDKNNNLLETHQRIVGDVKKHNKYHIKINLSDFSSFNTLLSINYEKISVIGGTITYLQ